jgi:sugar phosphate isomerase/epimerase
MASIMKFGITTYIWAADFTPSHLDVLPRVKAWGFDGIELPIFRPQGFPAAELRRGIERAGLECTAAIALVRGLSLVDDDADVRRRSLAHVRDTIKVTADLGAGCWPDRPTRRSASCPGVGAPETSGSAPLTRIRPSSRPSPRTM